MALSEEENMESFELDGCCIWVYEKDGKVAVTIEHGKPMALIAVAAFIDMLGRPLGHHYEDGENCVLFLFEDKDPVARKWREVFPHLKKQEMQP
jgi:hypothetical protein